MLRIHIDLDLIGGYGREVLRGLMQYAGLAGNWEFIQPPMYTVDRKKKQSGGRIDGAVIMVHDVRTVRPFLKQGIPVVNVARTLDPAKLTSDHLATVLPNDAKIGRLAYSYFREKGFRSFAFCGHPTANWSTNRELAFAQAAQNDGYEVSIIDMADTVPSDWFVGLKKPVALLAANDRYAMNAIDACREHNIRVPEDLAILGVDNDTLISELVRPSLSSVVPGAFKVGLEAGRLLNAMMSGSKPPEAPIEIDPDGIITRNSTDVLTINDEDVVSAVRYIRLNAFNPISVEDVLNEVMVSRRKLERRFKSVLGRSLLDEIRRVRIDRAKELLRETDFDMPLIAEKCGFMSHVRFSTVFRQLSGMSPTQYRRSNRGPR